MGFVRSAVTSLLLASNAAAIDPIIMKGSKFFYENGTQFFMKGVAYQQEAGPGGKVDKDAKYIDPLADPEVCKRDVPLLAALGTNTIRTYAINPKKDHSECMAMLEKAGIYVIADLGEPALSINRDDPAWNVELFDRYKAVVDELGKYDNVIGFFSGNEVTNNATNTPASAYVKAATRDTKKHIADKVANGHRWMGVGYAANDDADIRIHMAQYFNCGPQEEAIDFWGYNIYSWCGKSTFEKSGYDVQVDFFSNYSVPIFLAEYGCNTVGGAEGRLWDDTRALYSDKMTGVFSGGIVYMFHQEENDYGLVKVKNGKAETMKNYDRLEKVMKEVEPTGVKMDNYEPTNSPAACPPLAKDWEVADVLPPTPDASLCNCMYNSLECAPADDLEEEDFGEIFGYICGQDETACAGIKSDTAAGVYGPYVMCNPREQLGHVLDSYYKNQGRSSTACKFQGQAQVVSPKAESKCSDALSSASSQVAFAATATAVASTPGSTSGSGSGSGSDAEGAAVGNVRMSMAAAMYGLLAMGIGAGIVLL
ncbi:hypothetical protein DL766_006022 [Monosporascus sp. MC13-8B]|uniref:1,3-beta-glucanosyltransferase n=1 Tax=Monosporascus cannonballus TaxID=155416 RepID=A0ABY0GYI5_9PEZI|nr:hypothetical protein DL762_007975 [Monosporascus cannonballus]RYO80502.1 hypothetical protein DL763_008904 [Monosporascus cannonballus]RYP28214.1 hypothetical protein DL766_006022 [Monosporascus sp. MC13-8B]